MTLSGLVCWNAWRWWVVLVILALPTFACASELPHHITFQRLLNDDASDTFNIGPVNDILQDSTGFMWFGGGRGLARYDTHSYKFFFYDPNNPDSISSNFISGIVEDQQGFLWVATANGLNRYDPRTEKFTRYFHNDDDPNSLAASGVNAIALNDQNELYIGTENGLSVLNASRTQFTQYRHQPDDPTSLDHSHIYTLFIDTKHQLWLGTKAGLNRFNAAAGNFTRWKNTALEHSADADNSVSRIGEDATGRLWIGNFSSGLFRLSADLTSVEWFQENSHQEGALQGSSIRKIMRDSHGDLWVAVDHAGIAKFNPDTNNFTHFRHDDRNSQSLSSDRVGTINEDKLGNLWVGTFPQGANFYDMNKTRFKTLTHDSQNTNSLGHDSIICLYADTENTIWIGTEGGLDAYNVKTKQFTHYQHDPNKPNSLRFNAVTGITQTPNGDLWVGTWSGGLHKFNKATGEFKNYFPNKNNPTSLPSPYIWNLESDAAGNLWLAFTDGGGVAKYNAATDSFQSYLHSNQNPDSISANFVNRIFLDRQGTLWVGTSVGLDKLDSKTGKFIHLKSIKLPNSTHLEEGIQAIAEDHLGNMWLGVADGSIRQINKQGQLLSHYDVSVGSPYIEIANILEDNDGNIWASSSRGIIRVTLSDGKIKLFRKSNGLAGDDSNRHAALKDKDGHLYFGSTEGVTQFNPADLTTKLSAPNVVITNFKIANKIVPVSAAGSPLKAAILHTDFIQLNHTQNIFSFEFAALNYSASSGNQYAYMLEGFDPNWNYIGNEHTASYTNLDPGRYVFKVIAANSDGVWNETGKKITILITPPWWKTYMAYIFYIVCLLWMVYIIYQYNITRLQHEKDKELNGELLKLSEIKDAFLANTSHELRTPVNGMVGMAESLAHDSDNVTDEQREKIQLIISSGKRLSNLINDILDYAKMADQDIVLHKSMVNMRQLVDQVISITAILAKNKNLVLHNCVNESAQYFYADKNRMEQVLINLISNAIKYSDDGEIQVSAELHNVHYVLTVQDRGIGIAQDDIEKLFVPFNQLESSAARRAGGTGLGLTVTRHLIERHDGTINVESTLGVGSRFILSFPYAETHQHLLSSPPSDDNSALSTKDANNLHAGTEQQALGISSAASNPTSASVLAPVLASNAAPPETLAATTAPPAVAEHKTTLLIADDDPVNCMILQQLAKRGGYNTVVVYDGALALSTLMSRADIALAILDVNMPKLSGFEVARKLRDDAQHKQTPVLFLSATITDEDRYMTRQLPFADIKMKPIERQELYASVESLLQANGRAKN